MSDEQLSYQLQDKDPKNDQLREALSAIAQELERFRNSAKSPLRSSSVSEDVLQKLITCKSVIKFKNNRLHKLKNNLRTICIVVKTILLAKENESSSLNSHLKIARSSLVDLPQQTRKNENLIHSLTEQNCVLRERLDTIYNSIHLGYQELQNVCNEGSGEQSAEIKLNKIIISCGQCYADYCNEKAKSSRLEQKNRFLHNKINILQNDLETTTDEVKSLRYYKERLKKETAFLRNNRNKNIVSTEHSEQQIHRSNPNLCVSSISNITKPVKSSAIDAKGLDLKSHLSLVKYLLDDQETLLDDMKSISRELISLEHVFL